MRLDTQPDQPARVDAKHARWVSSPTLGIQRCLFEGSDTENVPATSLVRYAPHSELADAGTTGCEEFLVLEGVLADDSGAYPAGTYVRNPLGGSHRPHTGPGCLVLLKHSAMEAADDMRVRRHTADPRLWQPGPAPGVRAVYLHRFAREETLLLDLAPGAALPSRDLPGGEELFVLTGECHDPVGTYGQHVWLRQPPRARAPRLQTDYGCRLFVKRGHLRPD